MTRHGPSLIPSCRSGCGSARGHTRVAATCRVIRASSFASAPGRASRAAASGWSHSSRANANWYGPDGAYPEGVTGANTPKGVSVEMLRRHLIALGGVAMVGAPIKGVGELLGDLGGLSPAPLPSRLSYVHVAPARDLAQHLREGVRAYGSDPEVSSAATATTERLLAVSGPEPIKRALLTAVAELHLHAGWAAFDAGLYGRTMRHYARALELAIRAGDAYCQALALNRAGLAAVEHGHPNDGLKMLQCGQFKAGDIPLDLGRTVVIGEGSRMAVGARAVADSATALDRLGDRETAWRWLAKAREQWRPARTDPAGDLDYVAACWEVDRGRLDAAEPFAAASVSRWEGLSRRARTQSSIVLATIDVRAGEPRGPQLAHDAITAVTKLSSVRVRRKLQPLTAALEARPGSDMRVLARMSQQVAGVGPQTAP
jgi:hypothetical protein